MSGAGSATQLMFPGMVQKKIDRDRDIHRESHPILQVNFTSNFQNMFDTIKKKRLETMKQHEK